MSRKPRPFRQTDITKAIKAALSAGLKIQGIKVSEKDFFVHCSENAASDQTPEDMTNEWDHVK